MCFVVCVHNFSLKVVLKQLKVFACSNPPLNYIIDSNFCLASNEKFIRVHIKPQGLVQPTPEGERH